MNYTAYLRVYQPLSAFHEPERSRWAAYAASSDRPRRRDALAAEHAQTLRRTELAERHAPSRALRPGDANRCGDVNRLGEVLQSGEVLQAGAESEHAYVRFADGVVYVCPWQIGLRCQLARDGLNSGDPGGNPSDLGLTRAVHRGVDRGWAARPYILSSGWTVPLAWFVPFSGTERWIAFGRECTRNCSRECGTWRGPCRGPCRGGDVRATAQVARTLLYVTTMSQARRRVARGLAAFHALTDCLWREPCHPHAERCPPRTEHGPMRVEPGEMRAGPDRLQAESGHLRWEAQDHLRREAQDHLWREAQDHLWREAQAHLRWAWEPEAEAELARTGRWLERFHPGSLVELDYGALVYLLSDSALCWDESVAEIGALIDGMSRGHCELAIAMYGRTQARWRRFGEFGQVN
jgi:hypothetical protein